MNEKKTERKLNSLPGDDGYVLTADFDHSATLVLFPYRSDVWNNVEKAQQTHINFIKELSLYEHVYVGVPQRAFDKAAALKNDRITVFELDQNDAWIRDSGPLFVKKGTDVRLVKNGFNAWGGLYDDWNDDLAITERLSYIFNCCYYENDFILEGGNITTDGNGTAILVENCIVNPKRNNLSKEEIENRLKRGLGLKKIIWLKKGFVEDETGGHVDNVCRFLPDGGVVISWTDDVSNPMYARCREIEEQLVGQMENIPVNKLITPTAQYRAAEETVDFDGAKKRLPSELLTASYVNYYETEKAVFLPQFMTIEDEIAIRQMKTLFKGRKIIPVYSREYILAGGCLHCLTLGIDRHIFTGMF